MDPSVRRRRRLGKIALIGALWTALWTALPGASGPAIASDSLTLTITPRDVWPPAPVNDLTATPGAEGQLLLQWTAPDGNDNLFPGNPQTVAGYLVRVATFSVASVGGSTTTWWSLATDVRSLPAPAIPASPPTPGAPGAAESLLLTQLEPGVTYYAALVSTDAAGNVSDADTAASGAQAHGLIADVAPPTPANLAASQGGAASLNVSWNAAGAYDLDFYRLFVDSTAPFDYADGWTVDIDSPSLNAVLSGLAAGTYHLRIIAVDKGAPAFPGLALQSPPSADVVAVITNGAFSPQAPFGVAIATTPTTATLSWQRTTRLANGTPFVDPLNATCVELCGYRVFRATSVALGTWTQVAAVSSSTLQWTDVASGPQFYYHVRGENAAGLSDRSLLRSAGNLSAYALAADDRSFLEIRAPQVPPFLGVPGDPMSAYLVAISSRPQDTGGRVIQSLDFSAARGGLISEPGMKLDGMGQVVLHFDLSASTSYTGAAYQGASAPSAQSLGVFWDNGRGFVQLFGRVDATAETVAADTPYLGVYQLRSVERTGGFAFSPAGVSNRFVTPNGDGKNDAVVFTYDNPKGSAVKTRILDVHGSVVAEDLPQGPVPDSRVWDGTSHGRSVPGGVYIYQIEAEGSVHTGTIVILK